VTSHLPLLRHIPAVFIFIACSLATPVNAQDHLHPGPGLPRGVPDFCAGPHVMSASSGNWSQESTWQGGQVPGADRTVMIAPGHEVIYDSDSGVSLRALCIEDGGRLAFVNTRATSLSVGTLLVRAGGELEVGTETAPIPADVTAEIVFADRAIDTTADPEQFGGGLLVFGKVRMHGAVKSPTFVRLAAAAGSGHPDPRAGDTSLTLSVAPTGWRVGDRMVLPDTRQLQVGERFDSIVLQTERLEVQGFTGDREISLTQALQFDHEGARSADRLSLDYLPHVGNLTRNVVIRSQDPDGTRGHTLYSQQADVDIRYVLFRDLGRTTNNQIDSTTFNADGTVAHLGTNQIGRYPAHFHHVRGPANPSNTGPQFRLVGNAFLDGRKWPITVHQSHYGDISHNVIYNASGAGVMTEDGNESYNVFDHNFVVAIEGQGNPNNPSRLPDNDGTDGAGLWFKGFNHIVRNNVVANVINREQFIVNGAGFYFAWPPSLHGSLSRLPLMRGADLTDPFQYETANMLAFPIPEFSGNEAYGAITTGLTLWQIGTDGYNVHNLGETIIKDLVVWHVHEEAFFGYPGHNLTFDGLIVRGHPRALGVHDGGVGFYTGDYKNRNLTIRRADIQGMATGISAAMATEGTFLLEDSRLQNYSENFSVATLETPGTQAEPDNRTMIIRNTNFVHMPKPVERPEHEVRPFVAISMQWNETPRNPDMYWDQKADRLFVYDYIVDDQGTGDDFQVFYLSQENASVAGGMVPCLDRPKAEIEGIVYHDQAPIRQEATFVCPISIQSPRITNVAPVAGPAGSVVTISGENFDANATVKFGALPATAQWAGPAVLTAIAPAHDDGAVSITVTNQDYQADVESDAFRYGMVDPPPPPPPPTPNTAPVAANDTYGTAIEDTPFVTGAGSVLGNDVDGEANPLTAILVTQAAHGTVALAANGTFTYTPGANFNGGDAFTYKASDGTLDSNIATVHVMVAPVNDRPVAADDAFTTSQAVPLKISAPGILANDSDIEGHSLRAVLVDQAESGWVTLSRSGGFLYVPTWNFVGTDRFTYRAKDTAESQHMATVTITVEPVMLIEPPPQINTEGDQVSLQIASTLPDRAKRKFSARDLPPGLHINPKSGLIHGTVGPRSDGIYDVRVFLAFDGGGDMVLFKWTVLPKKKPPVKPKGK
jgi:VCBS repeat-containing protein